MKKYILGLFVLSFVLIPWFSFAQVSDIYYPNPSISDCVSIVNNLRYRDRDVNKNGEVSTLQDFLQGKGYLNNEPTGYFGLLTVKAVKDFQRANNINSDGSVGPITRAKIQALTCGINPNPSESNYTGYLKPQGSTTTMWGTHTLVVGNCVSAPCPLMPTREYSVSANGSQTVLADLYRYQNSQVTIYGNLQWINLEGGFWGIIATRVVPIANNIIKPIINGVSGPQTLNSNQTGTWTVNATDSSGGNLSYNVMWGDEMVYANGSVSAYPYFPVQQSATFTHSYSQSGNYTVRFTVTNTDGQSASTSLSVRVGMYSIFPLGCNSLQGYSTINGLPC